MMTEEERREYLAVLISNFLDGSVSATLDPPTSVDYELADKILEDPVLSPQWTEEFLIRKVGDEFPMGKHGWTQEEALLASRYNGERWGAYEAVSRLATPWKVVEE